MTRTTLGIDGHREVIRARLASRRLEESDAEVIRDRQAERAWRAESAGLDHQRAGDESGAREYVIAGVAAASGKRQDQPFGMSTVLPSWRDSFGAPVRSAEDHRAHRFYISAREAFDRLMEDGEIRRVGGMWSLTDKGREVHFT